MQYIDKFDGFAYVRITSAYPAGILQKLQQSNISIYDIEAIDAFTIRFCAKRKDVMKVLHICEKRGDRADVEDWSGYIFYILRLIKRPVFLAGIIGWFLLAFWLPTRILFVTVSGADTLEDAYILECAAECGIQMGASGRKVRSEEVKNALLSKIPALQWAGVNTSGSIATIFVREKEKPNTESPKISITDILSSQDAIISDITVHTGTALLQPGQAVKKGQALISCYRDNGQILEFTGARGEIYGITRRRLSGVAPLQAYTRTHILDETRNFYVIIGKKQINFQKDSGILDASCVKMYDVKEYTLPGNFSLPILLVTEHIVRYAFEPINLAESDCQWLDASLRNYLEGDMIAGSILSAATTSEVTNEACYISGTYDCREMIAECEFEGMTNNHGKDS